MKVVVAGGSGFVGREVVNDLVKSDEVKELCILDFNIDEAEKLAAQYGEKVCAQFIDITEEQ